MKIIILLLIVSTNAMAAQFNFSRMSVVPGFDIRFELTHDTEHANVADLDCQSFIQKIDFYDEQGNLLSDNPIDISQCEYLHQQVVSCFDSNQDKCFDTEDLFRNSCLCD